MNTERENFRDVHLPEYNEEAAVIALHNNIDDAVEYQERVLESGIDPYDQITITVNGIQHAFLLGGPQIQALCYFIENICEENGYAVPWETEPGDVHFDVVMHQEAVCTKCGICPAEFGVELGGKCIRGELK